MLENLPIQFDNPIALLLLLLILPTWVIARRSIGGLSRAKAYTSFFARTFVILILAVTLAEPIWAKRGEGLTTMFLVDRSHSVPVAAQTAAHEFLEKVADAKDDPDDRIGVITIGTDAAIQAMPDRNSRVPLADHPGELTATNLAAGVRLALALMPQDTAKRILLVSDGNETVESVLAAADLARANEIPIDVLPLKYAYENEIIFEAIKAPTRARLGQTADVKLVLRSQREASGTLYLWENEQPVDLEPDSAGSGRRVDLAPGPNLIPVSLSLDESGAMRYRAVFNPDDPGMDVVDRNNEAVGVTFVSGKGKVLIIDDGETESESLAKALRKGEIEVDVRPPEAVPGDLAFLNGYDAIILANIPYWALAADHDQLLHAYVQDLGGGLVMLGGPESFGAGGWIDKELAKALPIKLDPPQTLQMPRGALALVMHSCEMPQGNFWGQQVAISAVEALSRLDYVGIITFNFGGGGQGINGSTWAYPMQLAGDKSAAIAAAKKMVVGDMPDFAGSMQLGLQGLTNLNAGQKHMIIISDGDPSPPSQALLDKFIGAGITITTVMVAGHGSQMDMASMKATANLTGGRFYNVTNPKNLPKIFTKEAQLVARSLIVEGDIFQPEVVSVMPGPIDGFYQVPTIRGYVLTAAREGLSQIPIISRTTESEDPVYAHWNYGLGKSIAFTSDISGRWGTAWANWSDFQAFWEQSIRWAMRPASPSNVIVDTRVEGDVVRVEVEATDEKEGFLSFSRVESKVLLPNHSATDLTLQQIGPGRYYGEFPVGEQGAYMVNVSFAGGSDGSVRGSVQAAVSVPYAKEYRSIRDNEALLRALADKTNGRVLGFTDPAIQNVFDRTGLQIPRSPKAMWDLLAIIAAGLFVLDVAVRRIAIDPKAIAAIFGRAVGRRSEVGEDTMDAWRRARGQVSHRKEQAAAAGVTTKLRPEEAADRRTRFEAAEGDERTAIDVGGETESAPRDRIETPQREAPPTDAAEDEDYTSRLLAAKRRAQRDPKEEGDGDA